MKTYFDKFPKFFYDIDGTGTNVQWVTDILHRAKFLKVVLANSLIFYPYIVKDGETPEIIAAKLYGSSNYYWIVMYCNDIFSLWDEWPLSYEQMQAYLTAKYGSVETAQTTIDHWEDSYGNTIDLATYNNNVSTSKIVYADQAAIAANAIKAQIKLLDPYYVPQVDAQLDALLVPVGT